MVTQEKRSTAHGEGTTDSTVDDSGLNDGGMPRQWRWLLPLAVGASTAAWVAGVTSGLTHGPTRILLMVAGAVFTATAAGVPLWQQGRAARARADAVAAAQSARAAMRIAIEDALDPFSGLLLQLATARAADKARLRGEAIQLALTTVAQLSGLGAPGGPSRRLRVCYFALDPGPPRRLVPQSYAGRSGAPTTTFDDSSRAGQFLLRVADDGWLVVDDVDRRPTRVWWDEQHAYRTFAAGPVPGPDGGAVGLLTVDGLVPGDLDALDLPLVHLLARLLSLALRL